MTFLENYFASIKSKEIQDSVFSVAKKIFTDKDKLGNFDYKSQTSGLLLGEVQSGKTGQMFGIIAAAADKEFKVFLILTTDNSRLQQQTFKRALDSFSNFCVCDEKDTLRFKMNKMRLPVIVVLKKNSSVLKKWRNELLNSRFLDGSPLFIVDDEADAASLNTKVNKNDISAINRNINDIRKTSSSCVYLQVTATPQAVLLQTTVSEFKPSFVVYFSPGGMYLGGDFFFSKPEPYCIIETDEKEIKTIIDPNEIDNTWLSRAILNFLVVCSQFKLSNYSNVCNFLIHPSTKIKDHAVVTEKIGETLNEILQSITDNDDLIKESLKTEWVNLQTTKPEIKPFDDIYDCIKDMLFHSEIKPYTINSKSPADISFDNGFNIVVGGNILGRGVTFPNLQTIYYLRTAKTPQADTYWQHCRMFGYDRDRSLIRLFMPFSIFKLFQELNESQKALIKQISVHGIDSTHLLYSKNIRPTRKNVVLSKKLSIIAGGVNYFSAFPINKSLDDLNKILLPYDGKDMKECGIDFIIQILSYLDSEDRNNDWDSREFINAVKMAADKQHLKKAKLLVSVGHKIKKNTGTMLSQDDRNKIDKCVSDISLIMYQLTGDKELGWSGKPLWMPNIKLPDGFIFYKME
ncbi:protein containing Z1 domain [Candidatus Termititenax aidoneus]|uniref:Protein containing Z1 domain n=1 Tax=Termititenax aidoneus TaxID=2218524 RepID=A0A388TE42_TERA1|nr:protein containing Z1 domain [Candidatus Termititenax aidoneus]